MAETYEELVQSAMRTIRAGGGECDHGVTPEILAEARRRLKQPELKKAS